MNKVVAGGKQSEPTLLTKIPAADADNLQFYSKSADIDDIGLGLPAWRKHLSNFAKVPGGLVFDGQRYPTVEHAFQAAKFQYTARPSDAARFERPMTAVAAKAAGSRAGMMKVGLALDRVRWEEACDDIMKRALQARYDADPDFRRILEAVAATGKQLLHFERRGGYWGGKVKDGVVVGQNKLGQMLMALLPIEPTKRLRLA